MATINLGAIKFNWKGAYNSSTSYAVDDVVSSGGNSYVCIQAHSNQAVGNATAYWNIMSSAGTNGTDVGATLANKEIAFKTNAGALDGIPIGTAGQALKVNSGATGYEFGTAGGILQVLQAVKTDTQSFSGLSTTFSDISGLSVTITPSSSSSKFLIISSVFIGSGGNPSQSRLMRDSTAIFIGDASSSRTRSTAQYHGTGDNLSGQHHSYSFLDSPASSSAITYKPQLSIGGTATHYVNKLARDNDAQAEDNRLASSFIVMEVGV